MLRIINIVLQSFMSYNRPKRSMVHKHKPDLVLADNDRQELRRNDFLEQLLASNRKGYEHIYLS